MKNYISIKDGFDFLNKSKIKAGDGLSEGDFPFYTSSSIQSKFLNDYEIVDESLIFGTGGSASIHYSRGKFSTSTDCFVIQSNNKYEIDLKYVYFYLFANIHILDDGFKGAGLKHISKKYLEEIKIPFLPLETQKKIVEALDKAQALIDARKEQIRLMDELVKSRFVEMFGDPGLNTMGWKQTTIGEIAEIKIGPFGTLLHKEDYVENGHALVNPSHIVDGKILIDKKMTISNKKYNELAAYHLKIGDIVLGRRGEMGRCAVVYNEGFLCGTGSIIIRPSSFIKAFFLHNILSSITYRKIIEGKAVGVTMMNLNTQIVSSLKIPEFPLELHDQFITFLKMIDSSKSELQKSLGELITTQQALMQQYFG